MPYSVVDDILAAELPPIAGSRGAAATRSPAAATGSGGASFTLFVINPYILGAQQYMYTYDEAPAGGAASPDVGGTDSAGLPLPAK